VKINNREIGGSNPVYIIAEMSANHLQSYKRAVKIIGSAKLSGADAIKLQTYTSDTLTLNSNRNEFMISGGTPWDGQTLYELYSDIYMPWEWQPKLKKIADELGLDLISTTYDITSTDFLENIVSAYKIASYELTDLPLIRYTAKKGKPMILSTGMAILDEILDAVNEAGNTDLALLKCTSAYPAPIGNLNLLSITTLIKLFPDIIIGLSDHSTGYIAPVVAVSLGAKIIEKHFTLCRSDGGPDAQFSIEPDEFSLMVKYVRETELMLGNSEIGPTENEVPKFRRSLFATKQIRKGEMFSDSNIRSIRPADGIKPKFLPDILGTQANTDIEAGEPLRWEHISKD